MKVKIGGTTEFNVIPKAYESVKTSATFEIEEDMAEYSEEEIEELTKKVKNRLEKTMNTFVETSLHKYGETRKRLQEYLD
jgi:anaerobic ribonucleoside-triphosphate reductase